MVNHPSFCSDFTASVPDVEYFSTMSDSIDSQPSSTSVPDSLVQNISWNVLSELMTRTAAVTGRDYYPVLAEQLASNLDVHYAMIGEICQWEDGQPTRMRALCFWDGQGVAENFEYALVGTPCGQLLEQAGESSGNLCFCWFPEELQRQFPEDIDLVKLQAESYLGVALLDPDTRQPIGHICILDDRPLSIEKRHRAEILLSLFATRTVAELKREQAERREQDKILELERALRELQQTHSKLVQVEKISSLGQLVAGVAHEINNPLGCLTGNLAHLGDYTADLLEHLSLYQQQYPDPSPDISEHAENIDLDYLKEDIPKMGNSMKVSVDRIQEIVSSLRQFSRLDAEESLCDVHDGLESTLVVLRHRLKANPDRPEIQVIKEYDELPEILARPGQLSQVFMNLLSNAIDAVEEDNQDRSYGEIETKPNVIGIRTHYFQDDEGDRIAICITDNGTGIPVEVQPRLFETFFTTKDGERGTGLGLSLSRQIITENHRGSLSFDSTPGQGTEFIIELPVSPGDKG
ncbi:ATP-binding protein [Phormidium yuhuli AB48]|uniref:histidine kinase n=1 Tax=Phormidium yuhuli AB48 TaxID=2940671 RepID=A0ABY5ALA4_9CYAN|nr:ATP-binding protein [Phormidium yuhuli]USR89716.1 ATP-binding protein [Phormidium yuhuli AB48]